MGITDELLQIVRENIVRQQKEKDKIVKKLLKNANTPIGRLDLELFELENEQIELQDNLNICNQAIQDKQKAIAEYNSYLLSRRQGVSC